MRVEKREAEIKDDGQRERETGRCMQGAWSRLGEKWDVLSVAFTNAMAEGEG